jgi:outer membrane cobalamin receptor
LVGAKFLSVGVFSVFSCITLSNGMVKADIAYEEVSENSVDRIIVYGRSKQLIGATKSASEGVVGYDDFKLRPIFRVGELVEVIPGMIATQHSGTGKANQYFLRGFNLDHGTDFLATFEGMPINLPTHGHGQGYLDLNFIIPEIVETVEYQKGPYDSRVGDFSSAGSTQFNIYDRLDENFIQGTIGSGNYYRVVTGNSFELSEGDFLIATEGQFSDGPWIMDDDLEKYNSIINYTRDHGVFQSQFIGTAYYSKWKSTDQIPRRAVTTGLINDRGNLDDDLGGNTTRLSFLGKLDSDNIKTLLYAQHYDFDLFSNFTYFLNDPINGDEFEQVDNRNIFGGQMSYENEVYLNDTTVIWSIGATIRYDNITNVGLYKTRSRFRLDTVREDSVNELALGSFADLEFLLHEKLRVSTGLRVDRYNYSVDAFRNVNSGKGHAAILSPKFSAAYKIINEAEIYVNYGHGFHSNDVRGAAIKIDLASGDPVQSVPLFARSKGAEIGVRFEPTENLNVTFAGFWLDLQSELVFVGDAGTTEINDGSRRYGLEFSSFWQPFDWLALDVTAATTDAKFNLADDNHIPGSVGAVFGAGATLNFQNGVTGSLRIRHLGNAPLIEDNSVRSNPTTLVNFGLAYEFSSYTIDLDVFNVLNSKSNDVSYFYESKLENESLPVNDMHFHPVEPFTVRLGFRVQY